MGVLRLAQRGYGGLVMTSDEGKEVLVDAVFEALPAERGRPMTSASGYPSADQLELKIHIFDVPARPTPERVGVHDQRGLAAYIRHVAYAVERGATGGIIQGDQGVVIGEWSLAKKSD